MDNEWIDCKIHIKYADRHLKQNLKTGIFDWFKYINDNTPVEPAYCEYFMRSVYLRLLEPDIIGKKEDIDRIRFKIELLFGPF